MKLKHIENGKKKERKNATRLLIGVSTMYLYVKLLPCEAGGKFDWA